MPSPHPSERLRPLTALPAPVCAELRVVLADIDDTISTDGRLDAAAYAALEDLRAVGLRVVPVTGRPAGWCDMIARFWPVDGVVGENGAFYFRYDRTRRAMTRCFALGEAERAVNRARLAAIEARVLAEVPGAAVSADQPYRVADLAIDCSEDVPPLSASQIDRIVAIFEAAGATAKVSSIHVNGWFGSYDKLAMSRRLMAEALEVPLEDQARHVLYVGDSPNDEPMFRAFPLAVGVANVRDYVARLAHLPAFVTDQRSGHGFVELARHLILARGGR